MSRSCATHHIIGASTLFKNRRTPQHRSTRTLLAYQSLGSLNHRNLKRETGDCVCQKEKGATCVRPSLVSIICAWWKRKKKKSQQKRKKCSTLAPQYTSGTWYPEKKQPGPGMCRQQARSPQSLFRLEAILSVPSGSTSKSQYHTTVHMTLSIPSRHLFVFVFFRILYCHLGWIFNKTNTPNLYNTREKKKKKRLGLYTYKSTIHRDRALLVEL